MTSAPRPKDCLKAGDSHHGRLAVSVGSCFDALAARGGRAVDEHEGLAGCGRHLGRDPQRAYRAGDSS